MDSLDVLPRDPHGDLADDRSRGRVHHRDGVLGFEADEHLRGGAHGNAEAEERQGEEERARHHGEYTEESAPRDSSGYGLIGPARV